jgi:hypothetical protein
MKKLLFLLVIMLSWVVGNAQMATVTIPANLTYAAAPTTYTLTNAVSQYFQVNSAQHKAGTQDFLCHLDSLAGDHTNVSVALWGRKFDTSAWVAIGSAVNWKGTTSGHDTTIVISNATANRYRAYKIVYTGTGTGTTTITTQQFKLYLE